MTSLSNMAARDVETLIHPYTNLVRHRELGPMILEQGKGVHIHDDTGKRYIEGMAGLWCTALGYGNEELVEAAASQMRRLSYTHVFGGKSNDLAIELAETLKEVVPCAASKILFCGSGSEANDTQVKLTWYYNNARGATKRKKIISRQRAYHGVTVASGSLTGLPNVQTDFDLPIANILHTACPHYYRYAEDGESEDEFTTRLATELDDLVQREGPSTVAAFIAEPIMGAGGVIVPPASYFSRIEEVLTRYGIRFIVDEVICGFGRTGNWFGSQTFGIKPHSVSMAKAITSAYFPMGAIAIEEDLYQAMLDESRKLGQFGHGYTYTAHPVGCAVALKTLEIYKRDRIVETARRNSMLFEDRFRRLAEHPLVGDARAKGLIGAVELVADKKTKRPFDPAKLVGSQVVKFAEAHGLICRPLPGDIVALCPPLVIAPDEINEMFDMLTKALDDGENWVRKENLRAA